MLPVALLPVVVADGSAAAATGSVVSGVVDGPFWFSAGSDSPRSSIGANLD